jgi:hypothetical protein
MPLASIRIDALEHDHDGPLRLGEKPIGEFVELLAMAAGLGLRLVAAEPFAEIGVEVGEANVASGGNNERLVHGRGSLPWPPKSRTKRSTSGV